MKLGTYNPSLPHACDDESFNTGYRYGLVDRWEEGDFRVTDFTVFPEGVFTDEGLSLLEQALSQGWNHRNFFYYKRLGVNWFTGPAIESLIDFIKPELIVDQAIPERPARPDNPVDRLKKIQILHGNGATSIESPERPSSMWDVGPSILSVLESIKLEEGSDLVPDVRFVPPGFVMNGSRIWANITSFAKSGGMSALPLIQGLKHMGNTEFSRKLVDPLLNDVVFENFGKLLSDHGLFIDLWFDGYQWPAIARSVDPDILLRSDFDELCSLAYQYNPGKDVKKRFDLLREHSFWNLILKSLESGDLSLIISDWIDRYYPNRICIICGSEFNLFRQTGWIYFGSNGAKNICFNCPIVEFPGAGDIDVRIRDFVQACGFPPPDGFTPIDIRVTSVMDEKTLVEMIRKWSVMGGIDHVKQTSGVSWFESMVHAGSLPDGTIVTSRGVKSLADDGCVCLSVSERLIDDWLTENGVDHSREPLYPLHAEYNPNGRRRADWLVGDIYVEYFGLHGNHDYDKKTTAKLALARAEGINILPIYPTDMINLDEVLNGLIR